MCYFMLDEPANRTFERFVKIDFDFKEYVEEIFTDQHDISEDARMQTELTNQVLTELQVRDKGNFSICVVILGLIV